MAELSNTDARAIARYLYEVGQMKRIRRSGWLVVGIPNPESVAEHSYRVVLIGYCLARLEGVDPLAVVLQCMLHDIPEARLGDLHKLSQQHIGDWKQANLSAFEVQIKSLPSALGDEMKGLLAEYNTGDSQVAKITRDADLLECIFQMREYGLDQTIPNWVQGWRNALVTESARKIADTCLETGAEKWWEDNQK
jgi:putative hydrolases of HD superfamily